MSRPRARERSALALAVALTACALIVSASFGPASAAAPVAVHARIEGVINPITARYLRLALETARREDAAFLLLSINTPGGLVSSMQEMVSDIVNAPVPVVGFVEPPTAQATSAGAFLLLATDVAAMAPGTRVGAAHPVGSDKNLEGAMNEKATNSLAALAKSLAGRTGRSESYAESIVRQSASFTAEEAQKAGAVELLVPHVEALLDALDGRRVETAQRKVTIAARGVRIVPLPMSWSSRLLLALSDPTLGSILLTLGVLGILYEFSSPGVGAAGIAGAICLILALVSLATLPLHLGGIALILAGFVAIAAEVKSPAHGALALGGVIALALGGLVLIDERGYFGGVQRLDLRVFLPFIAVVTAAFVLLAAIAARALRAPAISGLEAMAGTRARARTRVTPEGGLVFASGSRWQAVSEGVIEEGAEVVVEEVLSSPTRLRVRGVSKGES